MQAGKSCETPLVASCGKVVRRGIGAPDPRRIAASRIDVFYLVTELHLGGAERQMFQLARSLHRAGWRVAAGCLFGAGEVAGWLRAEGIEVRCYDVPRRPASGFASLIADLRVLRPPILHCFLFHANLAGRLAGRLAGAPRILCSVRVCEPRPSHLLLDALTQGLCDRVVVNSEGLRAHCAGRGRIRPARIAVIPNGVDLELFPLRRDEPAGALAIGAAGRLEPQKGFEDLVEAVSLLKRGGVACKLRIAGDGPLRMRLEELALSGGIHDQVELCGRVEDMARFLAGFHVVALPSRWEGMPNVMLEAMATGVPVVATRIPGIEEVLDGGNCGVLVRAGSPALLAAAIAGLAADPAERRAMAINARKRVESRYGLERTVRAHLDLYASLLGRGG